jgi:dolichol-phosphate mannosyltransferase
MLLSILIPVYNEEKTVSRILKKVVESKLPKNVKKEIVIVDDGSVDKTIKILEKEIKKYDQSFSSNVNLNLKFILHKHEKNKGKGAAIRSALDKATGEAFIIQDADLEYDPDDYKKLLEPVLNKKAKVVFGTRLKDYPLRLWGENKTVLPTHWIANKVLTGMANFLYGSNISDMETCYKLFVREVVEGFRLTSNKFDIEPELTAKILLAGYMIHEVPIKTTPRTHEEGKKIKWTDGVAAVWTLLKHRVKL